MSNSYSILCIDDEENILNVLNRILRGEGYNVFLAKSGPEGLDILSKEQIDLVLCDQRMPQMSGFEVLRIVIKEYPDVMRIMLSGHSNFESLIKTISEGEIFRFISKPWSTQELKETIKAALEQKNIIREVKELLSNVEGKDSELIKHISVELSQDQSTILVKIAPAQESYSTENISKVLDYIFSTLGLQDNEKFQKISNSVIKEKDFLKFEMRLGKSMNLIIKVKTNELEGPEEALHDPDLE